MFSQNIIDNKRIWTYSNLLSISRLILGVFLYYFIVTRHSYLAILLALLAVITDYADGYVARKRGETSELGKILDPVADKVTVALGAIGLYQAYDLPLWIVILITGRDALILIGSIFLVDKVRGIVASEMPGKIAVTIISLLLIAYLFEWNPIKIPLLLITLAALIFSSIFYLIKFIKILKTS
ncbi:MAG: CDP-alcohol phosphatidyltransferase family protein [Calditrichia bacterium]|nr:CDP-alcohol phosphatidyltransferase family protein [Calditrichia bacterium]